MTRFILLRGKHGDSYWDASTLEMLDRSALQILEQKLGYDFISPLESDADRVYYDKHKPAAEMTDEEIANAPGGYAVKADLERKRQSARENMRWYEERDREVKKARELIAKKSSLRTRTRRVRTGNGDETQVVKTQYSEAWEFLRDATDGYEYGGVRLETLETPKERS